MMVALCNYPPLEAMQAGSCGPIRKFPKSPKRTRTNVYEAVAVLTAPVLKRSWMLSKWKPRRKIQIVKLNDCCSI